jgi:hypothetical protein
MSGGASVGPLAGTGSAARSCLSDPGRIAPITRVPGAGPSVAHGGDDPAPADGRLPTRKVIVMKKASRAFRARGVAGSIAGFLLVLIALVAVDERVARQLRLLFAQGPPREFDAVGDRLAALGNALLVAARDQSIDHAPMLVFTAVAVVLVFFMVRT